MRKIVLDVVALLPSCDHRGVDLQCETVENATGEVWADPDQLRQLLMNLVLNGVEAAGKSGWVRVELATREHATILRVLDSGPGPEGPMLERLFEPFATGKPEGIGLGLVVAQKIAEAHAGTIRYLDSRPTCFEVVLPESAINPRALGPSATRACRARCPSWKRERQR